MTTTAFDDQFTDAPEPVRQPYDTGSIMRRNVADLELALKQQTERAEAAEAALKEAQEQEPVAFWWIGPDGKDNGGPYRGKPSDSAIDNARNMGCEPQLLFAGPVSVPAAPAPSVPDGDDFNGTTPHMIQCIEALVSMNDRGVIIPHGIGSHARTLLLASANRLRQQAVPAVPENKK